MPPHVPTVYTTAKLSLIDETVLIGKTPDRIEPSAELCYAVLRTPASNLLVNYIYTST